MQLQHQKITLDVNDTRAFTVLNAHQGDSKTRFIDITLTESGNTITLSSNYVATVKASINNKTKAVNTAVVDATNNVVTVELTKTMLDTPGLLNCEVILQDNQQFVTSATFTVKVAESVISDESEIVASQEFGKLLDALIEIKDIEDKADRVQTLVDNIDKLESANDIVTRLSNVESKETQLETQHRTDVQALADKTNSIVDQANTDRQNFNNSVDEINTTLDTKENVSNKVSEITHPSLDYYPDTKAVFDYVNSKLETPLSDIESLKADFNSYKTSNDNAVNSKVDTTDFNTYKTATDKAVANNSALISKNQINVTTDKSTSIVLNDSSDCNIVDLKLHNTQANLYMCGKNFADFNTYFCKAQAWTTSGGTGSIVITRDTINKTMSFNSINSTSRSGVNVAWNNSGIPTSFLLGRIITISVDILTTDDCKFFLCNSCDNYKSTTKAIKANEKQRVSVTTTMPTDITKIRNTSVLFHIDGTITNVTLSNFQIELSTATDYEDYKAGQIVTSDTDLTTVHTYYPTTTVICDSDFQLTYIADPKNYIDNKFNEIATAIVAHESEVN